MISSFQIEIYYPSFS